MSGVSTIHAGASLGLPSPWTDQTGTALVDPQGRAKGFIGSAFAVLSASNTAAQNTAALQAAHDQLAGRGGWVIMPAGEFDLYGTVTVTAGDAGALGAQAVVFAGQGIGATVLTQTQAGVPTFTKTSGHAHEFRGFSLYGPGTGNADSVGIYWSNSAGGGRFVDLWVEGFGAGLRFLDGTSLMFENVHLYANDKNLQLGYNCDIFTFIGGRIMNAVTAGLEIGWRDAGHSTGGLVCNPLKFIGVPFGAEPLGISIPDYGASNIEFDACYFENCTRIASIGDAAQTVGPKQVKFRNCFFTWVGGGSGATTSQILANLNSNQETTLVLESCRSDDSTFAGKWVELGVNSRLEISDSILPSTVAHVGWNGGTYTIDYRRDFRIGRGRQEVVDGSVSGSLIPFDLSLTNGTSKTYAKFRRISATTGADTSQMPVLIRDIAALTVVDGGIMFATPSSALPTASSTYRGLAVYQQGGGGVADTVVCCMKDSAGSYSWKVVATG